VLIPAVVMLLLSVPMIWWISTYKSDSAVAMFVTTYVALLIIAVRMMRATLLEPHIRVHESILRQEEDRLADHRRASHASLARTELAMLARGEVTPVLDVWQIDPALRRRHIFIAGTSTCLVDPSFRELWIRVHLSSDWTLKRGGGQGGRLLTEVASYLRLLSSDALARSLKPYVATVVLDLRIRQEDASMTGLFVPVLSLQVAWVDLPRSVPNLHPPYIPGELRFSDGEPVEPFRDIPAGSGRATK
jgi:hypothetical protein